MIERKLWYEKSSENGEKEILYIMETRNACTIEVRDENDILLEIILSKKIDNEKYLRLKEDLVEMIKQEFNIDI